MIGLSICRHHFCPQKKLLDLNSLVSDQGKNLLKMLSSSLLINAGYGSPYTNATGL